MTETTGAKARGRMRSTTAVGHAVAACGLTQDDAAAYLGVPIDTMRSYASGRRNAPDEILDRLAALCAFLISRRKPEPDIPLAVVERRDALIGIADRIQGRVAV